MKRPEISGKRPHMLDISSICTELQMEEYDIYVKSLENKFVFD